MASNLSCILKAIGSVFVYLFVLIYFGIGIYNTYLMYSNCYNDLPYYFKIPFLMNDFIFAFFKMATRLYLKKENQIEQLCR